MKVIYLNKAQWGAFEKAGFDMRFYKLIEPMPKMEDGNSLNSAT